MEFTKITWPKVGIGTLAPKPKSLSGNVANHYDWTYSVYIANTTKEKYEKYVKKCIDVGFEKDISDYGDSFWADYAKDDEISIHVSYEGFDIMYISISGSILEDYSSYKNWIPWN